MSENKDHLIQQLSKTISYLFVIILILLTLILILVFNQEGEEEVAWCGVVDNSQFCGNGFVDNGTGTRLFKQNCASCHKADKKLIGPPLLRVSERYDLEKLAYFITNQSDLIAKGDSQVIASIKEYESEFIHQFPFSEDDVDMLIDYIVF